MSSICSTRRITVYNQTDGTYGIDLFEDNLLQIASKYPDASLLLAGDFNARCGNLQDILYDDNVSYIFYQDPVYESDDFHRSSKDLTQNAFGVSSIEMCKNFSMHIVNGRNNKSNRKAMNRNWSNQKANPALNPKREINKY